jgi:hypothetical protein
MRFSSSLSTVTLVQIASVAVSLACLTGARSASAQQGPLPPLPSQEPQYAPAQPAPYPQQQQPYYAPPPPPPGYGQPQYAPQPYYAPPPYYGQPQYAPPPPPEPPTHAPKFSLWTGARLGYLGFGGSFYGFQGASETTGNLVKNGPTVELDVGARLGRRYVPFVFYEHAFLPAGHRFEGNSSASAYSELYGIGFRYTGGDVDSAGFLTEISIGQRTVAVSDGTNTYKLSALEFFKLGLGAEIRVSTLIALSPLISISTGAMTDASGVANYTNTGDGVKHTPGGSTVDDQRAYVMLSLTFGVHFDVFGK